MIQWHEIVGLVGIGITIGLMALGFSFFLKIPIRAALIYALLIILFVLLIPLVTNYFSKCK